VADWQLDVRALDGSAVVTDAPFEELTFSYVLNGPGALDAQLTLTNSSITRANLAPGQRELRVLRDGVLIWGGYLWAARVELRDRVQVRAEGYASRLRRRYVMSDLIYTDVAQQTILRNLIDHTEAQASGDLGIDTTLAGNHTGGTVTRDRAYCAAEHPEVGASIDELTQPIDGLDWEITPTPAVATNKLVKTYQPRKGADLSGSVTLDQSELMTLGYEIDASEVASRVLTIGSDECNPPEDDRSDSTALTNFGLLQAIESIESGDLGEVSAFGQEVLRNQKVAHWLATASYLEAASGGREWGAFVVGDVITLSSNRGPSGGFGNFSQAMRVVEFSTVLQRPTHAFHTVSLDSVIA